MDWNDLEDFRISNKIKGKGALALMVQLTRSFSKDSLPIDPDDYVTGKQGQVAGLGEGNLKKNLCRPRDSKAACKGSGANQPRQHGFNAHVR